MTCKQRGADGRLVNLWREAAKSKSLLGTGCFFGLHLRESQLLRVGEPFLDEGGPSLRQGGGSLEVQELEIKTNSAKYWV